MEGDATTRASADGGRGTTDRLLGELRRVRRRAHVLLVAYRGLLLLLLAVLAALGVGVLDLFLRTPDWMRLIVLAGGLGLLGFGVWKYLLPALRFHPSLTDVALRLERVHPEFSGRLASAVDFARSDAPRSEVERALSGRLVEEVSSKWTWKSATGVLRPQGAVRRGSEMAGVVVVVVLLAVLSPTMFSIGAQRVLMPWSGAEWPRRTRVADATELRVHPLGTALPMRAALVRTPSTPEATDVAVRYRSIVDGEPTQSRRELLTWQERVVSVGEARGDLFERLIEPTGEFIEYRFETEDDETEWRRVRLVEPPAVVSARAVVTPPAYARRLGIVAEGDEVREDGAAVVDLGPGTDERALAPSALAGSRVELTILLNKPVEMGESVRGIFESPEGTEGVEIETGGREWRIEWTLDESVRLPIELVDEHGIASVDRAVYRFAAAQDEPPAATITMPQTDQSVLPTAVVDVRGEGRDDVGLAWVSIERRIAKPAGGDEGEPSGPGGAMEFEGEPVEIARIDGKAQRVAEATASVDLSVLGVRAGDEVHVAALASDIYLADGTERDPTRSGARIFRIISEEAFVEELRAGLTDIRQTAIRVEGRQRELRERLGERGAAREVRRGQSQISERLARQQDSVDRLEQRVEDNAFEDEVIRDLLEAARASLQSAGRASTEAARRLDEAAPEAAQDDEAELEEREAQEIGDAQREVEQELARLIEMLDRGEDNWVVRNTIENLLEQQAGLRDRTRQAGAETAGQRPEELDAQERSELEKIVERQMGLAEEFEQLREEMRERAEQLSEQDQAAATGMQQAARRAEQQQVGQTMEQAAQQAQQNQMTRAAQQQQQAVEAMEQMLEDLERGEQAREEVLKRVLRSIIESLEGLIEDQETQLAALDEDDAPARAGALAEAMIRLNKNTLGVVDLARGSGPELAPVANLVDQASDAQSRAIRALRAAAIEINDVRDHEARSLDLLNRAKERAEEIEQEMEQRERERKLQELKQAYRGVLETQVTLETDTRRFAQLDDLSRRDRMLLRRSGQTQGEVRDRLSAILEETQELAEARVFEYAHERLDALTARAAQSMDGGDPHGALPAQREAITLLQGLLEALADPPPDESEFSEGQQAGGGGGQGAGGGPQQLIPPLKELRLLRMMQRGVAAETREIAESGEASATRVEEVGELQRDLSEIGQNLVERMMQEGGGGGPVPVPEGIEPGEGEEQGDDAPEGVAGDAQ